MSILEPMIKPAPCRLGCMQTDATLLANNFQHCWMLHVGSVCTLCCILLEVVVCCCTKFETGHTLSPMQMDATLLANNSQHCWELLCLFARSLTQSTNLFSSLQSITFWGLPSPDLLQYTYLVL